MDRRNFLKTALVAAASASVPATGLATAPAGVPTFVLSKGTVTLLDAAQPAKIAPFPGMALTWCERDEVDGVFWRYATEAVEMVVGREYHAVPEDKAMTQWGIKHWIVRLVPLNDPLGF